MKKDMALAAKIRQMKRGDTFTVKTSSERKKAISAGKTLRDAGIIDFEIKTWIDHFDNGQFKVCAV